MATADLAKSDFPITGEPFSPEAITSTLILDEQLAEKIRQERAESGIDRFDEVWEGVYVMAPIANNEHQDFSTKLATVFCTKIDFEKLGSTYAGINVSDRVRNWSHNFRIPDVAVFLNDTLATNHGTFWHGGPDFAVEIASKKDRTREKLDFYAKVKTSELLIVDRDPWRLELLRLDGDKLASVGVATVDSGDTLASKAIPFTFALQAGQPRPMIRVTHAEDGSGWDI